MEVNRKKITKRRKRPEKGGLFSYVGFCFWRRLCPAFSVVFCMFWLVSSLSFLYKAKTQTFSFFVSCSCLPCCAVFKRICQQKSFKSFFLFSSLPFQKAFFVFIRHPLETLVAFLGFQTHVLLDSSFVFLSCFQHIPGVALLGLVKCVCPNTLWNTASAFAYTPQSESPIPVIYLLRCLLF